MSIFSKLKMSKKAAKDHKQHEQEAAQQENKPVKVPYKHVPTHAAVDALSGAPSSWKQADRPKIKAENSRRSIMAVSRTGSSMSVGMASGTATPASARPQLGRDLSYSNLSPTWWDRGDNEHIRQAFVSQGGQKLPRSRSYMGVDSVIGSSMQATPVLSESE